MEELKRALVELVEREPDFLADLLARLDGRLAERLLARPEAAAALLKAAAASPEAVRAFALAVAGDPEALRTFAAAVARDPEAARLMAAATAPHVAIPLNMATREDVQRLEKAIADIKASMVTKEEAARFATKEDLQRFATKEDLKRIERKMATKSQLERLSISLEEEAREVVRLALERRGLKAECVEFRLEGAEWDGLCLAGGLAVLVEAKVRSSAAQVERTARRFERLLASPPPQLAGRRAVAAHYAMRYAGERTEIDQRGLRHVDDTAAIETARRHRIWLFREGRELTTLEEL